MEGILTFAKTLTRGVVRAGDTAVDATVGNGHDTLFLADLVGSNGRVYGFDVQAVALERAAQRLEEAGVQDRVHLIQQGHEHMAETVPVEARDSLRAVMFNLGYLPGSDRSRITEPSTTISALQAAADLVQPGGVITVVVYSGHEGGTEEAEAVEAWSNALDQRAFRALSYRFVNRRNDPPRLIAVEKKEM